MLLKKTYQMPNIVVLRVSGSISHLQALTMSLKTLLIYSRPSRMTNHYVIA
jgi:hypothetical protein